MDKIILLLRIRISSKTAVSEIIQNPDLLIGFHAGILFDPYRVQTDIPGHFFQITVGINQMRFIPALVQMAGAVVAEVEGQRIGNIEMTHETRQIPFRRRH